MLITPSRTNCSPLAKYVRTDTLSNLKSAKYFATLCDETKDIGKIGAIVHMFAFCILWSPYEDFYNFVKADGLVSRSIMAVLKKQLDGMGVGTASHLIAQCYHGAIVSQAEACVAVIATLGSVIKSVEHCR